MLLHFMHTFLAVISLVASCDYDKIEPRSFYETRRES